MQETHSLFVPQWRQETHTCVYLITLGSSQAQTFSQSSPPSFQNPYPLMRCQLLLLADISWAWRQWGTGWISICPRALQLVTVYEGRPGTLNVCSCWLQLHLQLFFLPGSPVLPQQLLPHRELAFQLIFLS